MKNVSKKLSILIIALLSVTFLFGFASVDDNEEVYLCGFAAGFEVKTKGATVLKTTDVVTEKGVISPSDGKILSGDVILNVGSVEILCAEDVDKGIKSAGEGEVTLVIMRNGEKLIKSVTPALDISGNMRLGLMLKDGTSGIGTMTFIRKSGDFMALGHPISGADGEILPISGGELFRCSVFGVNKAGGGSAGELKGMFIGDAPIGVIKGNVEQGIFGTIDNKFGKEKLPLIKIGEAKVGKASVVTCVDGVIPKEYEILLIKADGQRGSKNLVIKVTDEELLSVAGGIVQGMSGSPVVQDGRLVGAITHVFVNDPTRGYGITAQNMLNALSAQAKAA